jgi:hypothetical protein
MAAIQKDIAPNTNFSLFIYPYFGFRPLFFQRDDSMDESIWTVNHHYLSLWCLRTAQFLLSAVNHRYLIHCVQIQHSRINNNITVCFKQIKRYKKVFLLNFVTLPTPSKPCVPHEKPFITELRAMYFFFLIFLQIINQTSHIPYFRRQFRLPHQWKY